MQCEVSSAKSAVAVRSVECECGVGRVQCPGLCYQKLNFLASFD